MSNLHLPPPANSHFYLPQTPELQNALCSIWQSDIGLDFRNETIIPKGVVEIIFDFGEQTPVRARLNDRPYEVAKGVITGFNTCPIYLQHPGRHTYFGIQLQPGAVKNLLHVPAREFSNCLTDLSLIDRAFPSLWHQLAEKSTFNERVAVVSKWVAGKTSPRSPQEKMLNLFLTHTRNAFQTVTGLANTLCYSARHLSRKTYELTGMNAEDVLLYKKYLHALHLMHTQETSLTEIAYHSGLSDQSHFIRSFNAFTGRTPGEYRRSRSRLPGHLYDNVR